jgi:hypothetical protein
LIVGNEAMCKAKYGGKTSQGKALLETDELLFRGDFRLAIPLKSVSSATADSGVLSVTWPGGTATFDLGKPAERWARRITSPPTLLDKLGIKEGTKVAAVGVSGFEGAPGKTSDVILLGVESTRDLGKVPGLRKKMRPDAALWIVYRRPDGRRKEIREADVMKACRDLGLEDNKTCRWSDTHTALRFVVPLADR